MEHSQQISAWEKLLAEVDFRGRDIHFVWNSLVYRGPIKEIKFNGLGLLTIQLFWTTTVYLDPFVEADSCWCYCSSRHRQRLQRRKFYLSVRNLDLPKLERDGGVIVMRCRGEKAGLVIICPEGDNLLPEKVRNFPDL